MGPATMFYINYVINQKKEKRNAVRLKLKVDVFLACTYFSDCHEKQVNLSK